MCIRKLETKWSAASSPSGRQCLISLALLLPAVGVIVYDLQSSSVSSPGRVPSTGPDISELLRAEQMQALQESWGFNQPELPQTLPSTSGHEGRSRVKQTKTSRSMRGQFPCYELHDVRACLHACRNACALKKHISCAALQLSFRSAIQTHTFHPKPSLLVGCSQSHTLGPRPKGSPQAVSEDICSSPAGYPWGWRTIA